MKRGLFIGAVVISLMSVPALAQPFYACGTPSERIVEMGAPVRIVELTYQVDALGNMRTVALTGGTNDQMNEYLDNILFPFPELDVLCVSGSKPVKWMHGWIVQIDSAQVVGLPSGISIGN